MSLDTSKMHAEQMAISLENILPSLAKNLYGDDWRISIRELLQNAHDALEERQQLGPVWPKGETAQIEVIPDAEAGTLTFRDTGSGMTLDEVKKYLATVGYGRKREQIEQLRKENKGLDALKNIIGQYGIGFLSSFIIADQVEVKTRSTHSERGVRAVFTGATQWFYEEISVEKPGTTVVVYLKKESVIDPIKGQKTFLKELLSFQRLQDEVRRFGDLLPFSIYVKRSPGDRSPVLCNSEVGPWEKPSCQKHQLVEFLKTRHPNENEPIWAEAFRLERHANQVEASGILYFPNPPREMRVSFESVSRVDLFCRRMFITDDIAPLLPDWANFVGLVIECPDLTPTLNRNDVIRHDPNFIALKQALDKQITEVLIFLAEKQPRDFLEFLGAHTERLYTGMMEDWNHSPQGTEQTSFFGTFIHYIPFNVVDRARPSGQFLTLKQYLRESEAVLREEGSQSSERHPIYYLGDPQAWGQFRAMIIQKGFPVIVPANPAETVVLKTFGKVFQEQIDLRDIRNEIELYVDKVDQTPYEQLKLFLRSLDGGGPDDVNVSKFAPNYVPAILTVSTADTSQQASMLEHFLQQGGSALDPKLRQTLERAMADSKAGRVSVMVTLNANNAIIQKLRDHCQAGRPLSGVAADVLHEVYHSARAVSDTSAALSDHYFEHRNSVLSGLVDLEREFSDLETRYTRMKAQQPKDDLPPGVETRACALLLTDLQGSTRMVGFLDAADSAELLRGYADRIKAVIEKHGGKVGQFTGDGIFASFWSAQMSPEALARNAANCAFEIHGVTDQFFSEPKARETLLLSGGITISRCRTALHFGNACYGTIAGASTVVGKNVVALFRTLEKQELFDMCPIVLTHPFMAYLRLNPQPGPIMTNVVVDASLPPLTFFSHPGMASQAKAKM